MKRFLLVTSLLSLLTFSTFSQVMKDSGVINTAWTGFSLPMKGDFAYHGVLDCVQTRIDIGLFTVDAMLNWGVLTNWSNGDFDNVIFTNTAESASSLHYRGRYSGGNYENWFNSVSNRDIAAWFAEKKYNTAKKNDRGLSNAIHTQMEQLPYYLNFLFHPFKGFDIGIGTNLDWSVGPAPSYNGNVWDAGAHVRQGGFSTHYDNIRGEANPSHRYIPDAPGSADVVGFVPYANTYAKSAIGARYTFTGKIGFQVGTVIPDLMDTDHPVINVGGSISPLKWMTISTAFEGLCWSDWNWYVGLDMQLKYFGLDVYFTWDNIDLDDDDDMASSVGVAFSIKLNEDTILLRPEASINWFENTKWTPAWYVGLLFDWKIAPSMQFGVWGSFAMGSMNKDWDDVKETEDWDGGNIVSVRPEFTFIFSDIHSLSAYVNFENRHAFNGTNRFGFSTGVYWTVKLFTGKATFLQKERVTADDLKPKN